jgi:pyruvate kinase
LPNSQTPSSGNEVKEMFRRTKIVATVGPACEARKTLEGLVNAGTDVFRLNFSHGDIRGKADWISRIRSLTRGNQRTVAILGDLQGPKIRIGLLRGGRQELNAGTRVTLTTRNMLGEEGIIPTGYANLPADVRIGDRILLDDGLIELEVLSIAGGDILCEVRAGGTLTDRKGINLPGVTISMPALTEKDIDDLRFCIQQGIDYVALSFVRKAEDVRQLKAFLHQEKSAIRVVAKIEKPEAVEEFEAILDAADGVMVARGDLGVEMSPERVPLIQKAIIRKCNAMGKPVITATQMLESMIAHPRPTRAETSDVANAILDGTDAVMLSGETAVGAYPVEAVSTIVRVAMDVERDPAIRRHGRHTVPLVQEHKRLSEAIGQAACRIAEDIEAAAILAFTQTGGTAALVAKYRPPVPIYAVTPSETVRRRMALYAGVRPLKVRAHGSTEGQIRAVEEVILSSGLLKEGEVVVVTMGSPVSAPGTTNIVKVHRLGTEQ